ncbi:MAG: hypothetical protein WC938_03600 [Candidatus Paceibacterota bacterium]|jgi:hypothetical protein
MEKKIIPDMTVIYLTANLIPEKFANFQRDILLEAIGYTPLISVSRKPLDFGLNIIDDGKKCTHNIYVQMLRAAKIAKTKYVAVAEDDALYHESHFTFHRPADDVFAYDQNRLALFTWNEPIYHWRNRRSNCSLIAPRELLIEALEERFAKWPNGIPENIVGELGRGMVERNLKVTERKSEDVFNKFSIIHFNHEAASELRQRIHRKSYGPIKAYDIPIWGKASDLVKKYE